MDAFAIALGEVLTQPQEGDIDHCIAFARRKLLYLKQNYNTIQREGLDMVYALHKYKHHLLGQHFKMFTDHSALIYLLIIQCWGERYADDYSYFNNLTLKLW